MKELEQRWGFVSRGPLHRSPAVTDDGLVLGYGTVLIRQSVTGFDLDGDAARASCLLAITGRRTPAANTLHGLRRAFKCWEDGDKCLAQIHIAFTAPARAENADDAWRLFLADELLQAGMAPETLLKALDLDPWHQSLANTIRTSRAIPREAGGPAANGRKIRPQGRPHQRHPLRRARPHAC